MMTHWGNSVYKFPCCHIYQFNYLKMSRWIYLVSLCMCVYLSLWHDFPFKGTFFSCVLFFLSYLKVYRHWENLLRFEWRQGCSYCYFVSFCVSIRCLNEDEGIRISTKKKRQNKSNWKQFLEIKRSQRDGSGWLNGQLRAHVWPLVNVNFGWLSVRFLVEKMSHCCHMQHFHSHYFQKFKRILIQN